MTQTLSTTGFTQEAFDQLLASREGEPDWLTDQRQAAWKVFCEQELPHQKEEEWIRTDIRLFKLDKFGIPNEVSTGDAATPLLSEGVALGGSGSSINGQSIGASLESKWAAKGVIYCTLEEAAREHGDLLKQYLHTAVDPHFDKFSSLHASCWTSGMFLYVPRGVSIDQPLHALGTITCGGVDLGHTLVVLEEKRRSDFAERMGKSSRRRHGSLLRSHRDNSKAQFAFAICESSRLGQRRLALRPSKGHRGPKCIAAVDRRGAG